MSKKLRLLSLLMRSGDFERSSAAEQAVLDGRVTVDGAKATNPGHSVKAHAAVKLDGHPLEVKPFVYMILNKEAGMVCQKTDKEKSVYDVIASMEEIDPKTRAGLFCVGRLDRDTEGLLIVTNDGQLEKLLTKSGNRVLKTYSVGTAAPVSDDDITALQRGVEIEDDDTDKAFFVKAIAIKRLDERRVEIGINEGRKRQVKKMFEVLGNSVVSLRRVAIGGLRLENLDFKGKRYLIIDKRDLKLPR
jgi:pseudouridine synthase